MEEQQPDYRQTTSSVRLLRSRDITVPPTHRYVAAGHEVTSAGTCKQVKKASQTARAPEQELIQEHLLNLANDDFDRLHRLRAALEKVQEIQGSPDIIKSLLEAINQTQKDNDV